MNTILVPSKVQSVFFDCLFKDGEDTTGYIPAEGVVGAVGFHPARLESHRAEIYTMLNELPGPFKKSSGGGWSFLNACNDRHGEQWTGEHQTMEMLFQLGIGLGVVRACFRKEMWSVLPGGMPYYVIDIPDNIQEPIP